MIIDLGRFCAEEEPIWEELDRILRHLEEDPGRVLSLEEIKRFHFLYQRTSNDLAKVQTFSSEPRLVHYLDALVSRAYAEIHELRERPTRLAPVRWFLTTFPQTVRRHSRALALSCAITLLGGLFGAGAIALDPGAKEMLMPFPHLQMDPSERVAMEEKAVEDRLEGGKAAFSAFLMTHNLRVSIMVMALGVTYGVGSLLLLLQNGILLGAVAADYALAGETTFLVGWLLPHGAVEIPAVLLAGQAGFTLAGALIGWGERLSLKARLRKVTPDLVTLVGGIAVLLVWAGFVESFLSQVHEPVIPYAVKIGLGMVELALLILFLTRCGRGKRDRLCPE